MLKILIIMFVILYIFSIIKENYEGYNEYDELVVSTGDKLPHDNNIIIERDITKENKAEIILNKIEKL